MLRFINILAVLLFLFTNTLQGAEALSNLKVYDIELSDKEITGDNTFKLNYKLKVEGAIYMCINMAIQIKKGNQITEYHRWGLPSSLCDRLQNGEDITQTWSVQLPNWGKGFYEVSIHADVNNYVSESNEDDNTLSQLIERRNPELEIAQTLRYPSLYDINQRINDHNWQPILNRIYASYKACQSISEKADKFDKLFSGYQLNKEEREFLINVCHAIWVENRSNLEWSLASYTKDEIRFLFEHTAEDLVEDWAGDRKGRSGCWSVQEDHIWHETYTIAQYLTAGTHSQEEALEAIYSWVMKNFFHYYKDSSCDADWPRIPGNESLLKIFQERSIGCHFGAKILSTLLKAVNIPAVEIHYNSHAIAFTPNIDRYVHGDYLADFTFLREPEILSMSISDLETWIMNDRGYLTLYDHLQGNNELNASLGRHGNYLYLYRSCSTAPSPPEEVPAFNLPLDEQTRAELIDGLWEYNIYREDGRYKSIPILIPPLEAITLPLDLNVQTQLTEGNILEVVIQNQSNFAIQTNRELITIYADGQPIRNWRLTPNGRKPQGVTTINTGHQLGENSQFIKVVCTDKFNPCQPPLVFYFNAKAGTCIGIVQHGNVLWTNQNLNLAINDSWCYDNDSANCEKYGRMYSWTAAKEACSSLGQGWKLPSDEQWNHLIVDQAGGAYWDGTQGSKSIKVGYSFSKGYHTLVVDPQFGFKIKFGGEKYPSSSGFRNLGNNGSFWVDEEISEDPRIATQYLFNKNTKMVRKHKAMKTLSISCRCIKTLAN